MSIGYRSPYMIQNVSRRRETNRDNTVTNPIAPPKQPFDAAELARITRSCRRWNGIDSLPPSIRAELDELDYLSARLRSQPAEQDVDFGLLLLLVTNCCQSLKGEFSKMQVSFECPSCPLGAN